jgi:hypothetical protein
MDPLGFALENYDAVGRWRTQAASLAIDASGALPDGTRFEGARGLIEAILRRPDAFATTVTERLLTYAIGRGPEYFDAPAVRTIRRDAAAQDYRFSAIVLGIVKSVPFQMRTAAYTSPRVGPAFQAGLRQTTTKSGSESTDHVHQPMALPRRTFLARSGRDARPAAAPMPWCRRFRRWRPRLREAARRLGFVYVPNGVIMTSGCRRPPARDLSYRRPFVHSSRCTARSWC